MLMNSFIDVARGNLEIDRLTRNKAERAIYYLDFLLDHEGEMHELVQLHKLKNELLKKIHHLDTLVKRRFS